MASEHASTNELLPGNFLVKGSNNESTSHDDINQYPLRISDTSLSFWGGIDPLTGIVVDTSHPLHGICVTDTILCLPSGRGSCTASQVLLELILNHKAPAAFCFRDVDGLACVGAIVAQEVFSSKEGIRIPDMIHVGSQAYDKLLLLQQQQQLQQSTTTPPDNQSVGCILQNGDFLVGEASYVKEQAESWKDDHSNDSSSPESTMRSLTDTEQSMLDNATTEAQRMAYRVLFQFAHLGLSKAEPPPPYLDIAQAHIDGCTYIGPGGLEFTQRLVQADGKVQVPTTLNSVSADRRHHQALGVPADYAANSIALGDAYLALGCQPSFTCAPYLLTTEPALGDQIAWGESNAVVYANSVLGAQTEKYADYLDICCAITGKVPAAGVHIAENRKPQVVLDATAMLDEVLNAMQAAGSSDGSNRIVDIDLEMLFPTLGHVCGTLSDGKVPVLVGFDQNAKWASLVTKDHLKAFCAAFGTTGTSPLAHIEGVTPESKADPNLTIEAKQNGPSKQVTWAHCEETFALLNQVGADGDKGTKTYIDLVALGNPHLSVAECHNLVTIIQSLPVSSSGPPKKNPNVRIMACLSREIHSQAEEQGHIQYLKDFGVEFINDTCWCMLLDAPVIPADPDATVLTNSGKYAHYGPGLTNRNYRYGSTADCINAAMTGYYPSDSVTANTSTAHTSPPLPRWLTLTPTTSGQHQRRSYSTFSINLSDAAPCSVQARLPRHVYESRPQSRSRSLGGYVLRMLKSIAKR